MTAEDTARNQQASLGRLLLVGAILLAEYLALSFAFDAQVVEERGGVWTVFGHFGAVGTFLVAAGAALLLLGPGLMTSGFPKPGPVRAIPAAVHLLSTAVFFWATGVLFAGATAPPGPALLWLTGWCLVGLASFSTLLLAGLGDLGWVLKTLSRALLVGGALGVLAWSAGVLASVLWEPISAATFRTVAWILAAVVGADLEIDFEARVLGLEGFRISVAAVCSGIEGLGLFFALMTGFLVQQRKVYRFPHALLLLPIGLLLTWTGNCIRIAGLMLLGAHVDPDVAIGSFHSKAGWVFFCAITIGLAVLSRRIPWVIRPSEGTPADRTQNPAAPYITPLLAWIAVSLVLSSLSNGHDPFYGVRVLVTGALLWHYRAEYSALLVRPSALAWGVGVAVGVLWLLVPTQSEAIVPLETWSDPAYYLWLFMRTLGAVIIIPLAEELAFRGYLARLLTKRDFLAVPLGQLSPLGILGSSLAFAALHERWELAAATGILYAALCRHRGQLIDAIAAHAASNAVIAIWVLATQNWQHW